MPVPQVKIPDAWEGTWLGHELEMRARALAEPTIKSRRTSFVSRARHAAAAGLDDPAHTTATALAHEVEAWLAARQLGRGTGA